MVLGYRLIGCIVFYTFGDPGCEYRLLAVLVAEGPDASDGGELFEVDGSNKVRLSAVDVLWLEIRSRPPGLVSTKTMNSSSAIWKTSSLSPPRFGRGFSPRFSKEEEAMFCRELYPAMSAAAICWGAIR